MKILKKAKKGFSLVELVVVIAVIAILSAVSVVTYMGVTENARQKACLSEADSCRTLIMTVLLDGDVHDLKIDNQGYLVWTGKKTGSQTIGTLLDESNDALDKVMEDVQGYDAKKAGLVLLGQSSTQYQVSFTSNSKTLSFNFRDPISF